MTNSAEFPGYYEKMKKAEQKEQKREKRKGERKNALPPFLMVRGGLFNEALIAALITIPLAEGVFYKYSKENVFAFFCYACLYCVPMLLGIIKFAIMNNEKNKIKSDLDYYTWGADRKLPSIKSYECKRMAQIMIKFASKHNPEFFNTLIENPKSVSDEKTASAIIRGHIKSHPEDIRQVLDTFQIRTIPKRLYKQLIKNKAR